MAVRGRLGARAPGQGRDVGVKGKGGEALKGRRGLDREGGEGEARWDCGKKGMFPRPQVCIWKSEGEERA